MKARNGLRRLALSAVMTFLLTFSIFVMASCDIIESILGGTECSEHTDADGNGLCDICDAKLEEKKPEPEQPDPEQPEPEKPDPEQPEPEQPEPEQPDPEQPDPEQPEPEQPEPEQPDPEQPEPEQPEPEQPDPEQPEPEQPEPEQPDPEQPDPEQPEPEKPEPEQPDPEQPEPEKPEPEQPDPEQPEPEKPDPEQPTPDEPTPDEPIPDEPTPEVSYRAEKKASVSSGATLYPTTYIAWSDTTLRGSIITYTITVFNTGNSVATVEIKDRIPDGTVYISGGDMKNGNELSWTVSAPVGGEASVSYTVEVTRGVDACGEAIEGSGATVNGEAVDCYDLYIEKTLNEVDREYIEKAITILSRSTYTGLEFAKHAYTVAFSNAKAITELLSGTPAEIIDLIFAATDAKLTSSVAIAVSADGATHGMLQASDLISGDIALILSDSGARMYIISAGKAYDITEKATKVDISELVSAANGAKKYAVVRPSFTMSCFTPSDPDEQPEQMNAYQEALVKTAEAYLLRGETLQYEDVYFGLVSATGEYRWTYGEKAPEEYTSDEWGYVNCAVFTYEAYLQALGFTLPNNMYTTANLTQYAAQNGMSVFRFERTRADVYTEAEQLAIEAEFMATLQVGDIIVRRHTNVSSGKTTGHAMLYVGNGRFIHSGGSSYSKTSDGVGYEIYEPTIRCHKVHDYLFGESLNSMFNDEDNIITIVRPLNKFNGEIPENAKNRVENMDGIMAEKLSSAPSSVTVNTGDLITFTFSIFNTNDTAKTVAVYDKIPAGCIYVSGGERVVGDELYWTVTVGAGEVATVSYTVKVDNVADGTIIDGRDGTVGGVMHRCAAVRVKKTLTATEQNAIISAIEELKSEGSGLSGLALVNEIYKRALGISGIFADTNADTVMRDGAESVFAKSSKTYSGKNLSTLRTTETYYSSMLVDHLYGGMRFYSASKLHDRTRLLKEHNLVVGDILIARTSSKANIYIWAGEDMGLILLNNGIGDPADFTTLSERILYFGRDFAVLRPSFVTE